MGRPKLKKIAESTIAFRISESDRKKIELLIQSKRASLNNLISDDEYQVTKNEVIIAALKIGLSELRLEDLPKRQKRKG